MGRILIADDEQQILEVMVDILESAGHEVVGVADGREAFNAIQSSGFDLAILDVMMPKLDGYHLAQAIQGLKNPPAIVIVTSRDFEGDKIALHAAGVSAFLPKPFSNKDLVEVVSKLLKNRGAH